MMRFDAKKKSLFVRLLLLFVCQRPKNLGGGCALRFNERPVVSRTDDVIGEVANHGMREMQIILAVSCIAYINPCVGFYMIIR